jgi:hypothetical protein
LHERECLRVKLEYSTSMNRRTALVTLAGSLPALRASDSSRTPVLVELFTSEGCSSCPPADALLMELERQPISGVEVVALSEHVDYWNHLGWQDAFSSPLFSARQQQYAAKFRMQSVYTPQMVIDGRAETVGNNSGDVYHAVQYAARTPKAVVRIEKTGAREDDGPDGVRVRAFADSIPQSLKGERFDLILAITEAGLSSPVANGENAGRLLKHAGVVRSMTRITELETKKNRGYSATLMTQVARSWNRSKLRAVLFLQSRETQAVAGVGWCSL